MKRNGGGIGLGEVFSWPAMLISVWSAALVTFIQITSLIEFKQLYVLTGWMVILGGSQTVVDPPPFELLQWLLLVAPPIYFVGAYLEQETRKRLPFVLSRIRSYGKWWFRIMKGILLGCLAHTLICFMIPTLSILIFGGGFYQPGGELLKEAMTPLVFYLYIVMASILQALCYVSWKDKRISFIVATLLPILSHILCYPSPQWAVWSPGSWGMASRYLTLVGTEGSKLVGNQYHIILPIMVLVSVGMFFLGKRLIVRRGIAIADE
ncbi:MAG: hypothetical protein ACOX6S_00890 [Clostridia bacterium]